MKYDEEERRGKIKVANLPPFCRQWHKSQIQKNRLSAATTLLYCFDYSTEFPWYPGRDLNSYSLTAEGF